MMTWGQSLLKSPRVQMSAFSPTFFTSFFLFSFQQALINAERPHPEQRQERTNAMRSMIHNCTVDNCFKMFQKRSELAKHCLVAHALVMKSTSNLKPMLKQLTTFQLLATPL